MALSVQKFLREIFRSKSTPRKNQRLPAAFWASERTKRFEQLDIKQLSKALWGGFAQGARNELIWRAATETNLIVRGKALLFLAQYEASEGRFQECVDFLNCAEYADDDMNRAAILKGYALAQTGQYEHARAAIETLSRDLSSTDAALVSAVVNPDFENRLSAFNAVFGENGLSHLSVSKSEQPTFDGLFSNSGIVQSSECLSVVVPAYNCASTLPAALNSIQAQSWRNLEIIIVDDASTDSTQMVAAAHASRDHRVKIIRHSENGGAYRARNTGLMAATGRYVTIHDADDWSHPQKFALQMQALVDHSFCTTMGVRVTTDLSPIVKATNSTILVENVSSLMGLTKEFQALGGWDRVKVGADSEFYERLQKTFKCAPTVVKPNAPLTLIRSDATSLTRQKATGLKSINFGCRREYRDAYRAWHSSAPGLSISGRAPFAAPRISTGAQIDEYGVIAIMNFSFVEDEFIDEIEWFLQRGEHVALLNQPTAATAKDMAVARVRALLLNPAIDLIVTGDTARGKIVMTSTRLSPVDVPDELPVIEGNFRFPGDFSRPFSREKV